VNCKQIETVAIEYLDGVLNAAQRADVERHLAACSDCHARLEGFRSVSLAMDAWNAPEVSPWFNARLWRRIAESEALRWNWRTILGAALRPSYVAALSVVLVLGSIAVWQEPQVRKTPAQVASQPAQVPTRVDDVWRVARDYELLNNFDVLAELEKAPSGKL
jgi:anti-sigma factor RsiW